MPDLRQHGTARTTPQATDDALAHLGIDHGGVDCASECKRIRWYLQQIITLAEESPQLTDRELRARLLALAESYGAR